MRRHTIREVDSTRLLPQILHTEGLRSPPAPGAAKPRLLAGLAFGSDEAGSSVQAHVMEADGSEQGYKRIRLVDLVKELWPEEKQTESICRSLRSLNDSTKQDFLLRVSRRAVWVRTDFVRAVVEPTRVTFLGADDPAFAAFIEEFKISSRSCQCEDGFRCWTVECIVCAAVTMHSLRLQVIRPVVESLLESLRSQALNSILKLYPLKMALTAFIEQMRPLEQGLRHVLQVEGEALVEEPDGCLGADSSMCSFLEDMLYNWSRTAEEVMAEATLMSAKIEDSMRFSDASMSCTRNQLLMFELWTNVATVAIGLGSLISGVFGMNLDNHGFDARPGMFYAVSAGIGLLMLLIVFACIFMVGRSLRHYNDHAPRFGNNRFFRHIGDDAYVLSLSNSLPCDAGAQKRRLLQELSEKSLPQHEEFLPGCCRRRPRASTLQISVP